MSRLVQGKRHLRVLRSRSFEGLDGCFLFRCTEWDISARGEGRVDALNSPTTKEAPLISTRQSYPDDLLFTPGSGLSRSLRNQYDIAGSLAWLAATICTSKNEALTKSKVQFIFQDLLLNEADASYRLILEPLEDSDRGLVICWHSLFVNAVLAVQFPIAERTHGYGIELSPFLMARLAGMIMPVHFLGGYILN